MISKPVLLKRFMCAAGLLFSAGALADNWQLNNSQSELAFMSLKNTHIAELHTFETLQGSVQTDGTFELTVPLDGVKTHIDIRDERMREYLFETKKYPAARITGMVPEDTLTELNTDKPQNLELKLAIHMRDQKVTKTAQVQAVKLSPTRLLVTTTQPLVLNAKDFGFEPGLEKLREIAGLDSITLAVPVTVNLVFDYQE